MLASTCDGDLFVWGCGLTHQLANRPRDVSNPADADEEPADELRPYRVSSKQLQKRFVMLADGGAQHSVELAWDGTYSTPSQDGAGTGQAAASSAQAAEGLNAGVASDALEPPAKRRATEQELADKSTGFAFGTGAGTTPTAFGASSAGSVVFGFSAGTAQASSTLQPAGGASSGALGSGFGGSFGSSFGSFGSSFGNSSSSFGGSFGSSFGQSGGGASAGTFSFGFGDKAVSFGLPAVPAAPESNTKELLQLPDFTTEQLPVGDVFVHGSGECDQLGLGDVVRERKKPTLMKSLQGKSICEIAVGAMHVLCVSAGGAIYSWGCNDDGALGRPSSDGSDGGPSDVEPHLVTMPCGVVVRHVSCGDGHSCAVDSNRRVWLWGTYKDSNGYIGIMQKRKQESEVMEKSAEPTLVLEGCLQIASGANHTVALAAPSSGGRKQVFAWGSNATGQLGLQDGCGFSERTLPCSGSVAGLAPREGGGCELDGEQVVRLHVTDGSVRSAGSMTAEQVQQAVAQGATKLVLQSADRDVPKTEKQKLLRPQEVPLPDAASGGPGELVASGVHASAECSFVTFQGGAVFGCGLNGDGQVGLGYMSMAVQQLQAVSAVHGASWLGGGLHSTAALAGGRVFSWGKAEECGLGLGAKASCA